MSEACAIPGQGLRVAPNAVPLPESAPPPAGATAELILAGGCFWCTEAVFAALKGVHSVESGYVGGSAESADYRRVCNGDTGHAEAIRIQFDGQQISAGELLKIFFAVAHDPTQKDRQGHDRGTQYRSAVFVHDAAEREFVERYIRQLDQAGIFTGPIATTVEPLTTFYRAEAYHQQYAARNPWQPYIQAVAVPKMEKLQHYFAAAIKADAESE
ncbi:peptide-methionine (S)-S-oxide reductase MsrA [Permianibacter sp. IMCC34836]|uniref:peptide-methionine (S)-S-oxide reductase MsrA n=1 Tax=Permianibacter fluminis TaxID=2738515 RepID=UPI0015523C4F|nr:peptide-methionine (S)-S-oxide reductase MsrA [Permianibacter fluminis]NQD36712.1 peptide-methionine (S)-S-oxide reductase MsrA [Permianibacter fluminis]